MLTHDIAIINRLKENEVIEELSQAIHVKVTPLTPENWYQLFQNAKFTSIESKIGPLSLMSPIGMIRDEGFFGTIKIIKNALKPQHRSMFKTMRKHKKNMNYIVHAIKK